MARACLHRNPGKEETYSQHIMSGLSGRRFSGRCPCRFNYKDMEEISNEKDQLHSLFDPNNNRTGFDIRGGLSSSHTDRVRFAQHCDQDIFLPGHELACLTESISMKRPFVNKCEGGSESLRKVRWLSPKTAVSIQGAKHICSQLLLDAQMMKWTEAKSCIIRGQLQKMTVTFFDVNTLVLDVDRQQMFLQSIIYDATGSLTVKVWDRPCFVLFDMAAQRLQDIWKDGNDHPEKRVVLLQQLNANLESTLLCLCKISVYSRGGCNSGFEAEVNMVGADML